MSEDGAAEGPSCSVGEPVERSYIHHIKEDTWGIFVITKREFIANIKSFRSIIMVIILALIMVGAAMGFARLAASDDVEEDMRFNVMAMDPDGLANDLVVFLYEKRTFEPIADRSIFLGIEELEIPVYNGTTDENGHWVAKNLTSGFHWLNIVNPDDGDGGGGIFGDSGPSTSSTYIYIAHDNSVPYPMLGVHAWDDDIRAAGVEADVAVHVTELDGSPLQGATVTLGSETNTTDARGMTTFLKVKKGLYNVTATGDGLTGITMVNVTHLETERDPFSFALAGPDEILRITASIAIGMVGPIYAIVLCFDAVFRERLTGSIDYLLCRPMGRRAVLTRPRRPDGAHLCGVAVECRGRLAVRGQGPHGRAGVGIPHLHGVPHRHLRAAPDHLLDPGQDHWHRHPLGNWSLDLLLHALQPHTPPGGLHCRYTQR